MTTPIAGSGTAGSGTARAHADLAGAAALLATAPPTDAGLDAIAEVLYGWYLNTTPLEPPTGPLVATDQNMAGALAAAHAERGRFLGGWRAEQVGTDGAVLARRGATTRLLHRAEYFCPQRPGSPPAAGEALLVTAAWTWTDPDTGFWHCCRGQWPPPGENHLVRTYLNVAPAQAPACLAILTDMLARHPDIPYQLKTPAATVHGGRADAMVLYLGANAAAALAAEIRVAAVAMDGRLRPAVPRFTRLVLPGVSQADGALEGASFGEHTCRLLATAWLALGAADRGDREAIVAAFRGALLAAGLDPAEPSVRPPVRVGAAAGDAGPGATDG